MFSEQKAQFPGSPYTLFWQGVMERFRGELENTPHFVRTGKLEGFQADLISTLDIALGRLLNFFLPPSEMDKATRNEFKFALARGGVYTLMKSSFLNEQRTVQFLAQELQIPADFSGPFAGQTVSQDLRVISGAGTILGNIGFTARVTPLPDLEIADASRIVWRPALARFSNPLSTTMYGVHPGQSRDDLVYLRMEKMSKAKAATVPEP